MFEIFKNVPMPEPKVEIRATLKLMEIGDMCVIPYTNNRRTGTYVIARRLGVKVRIKRQNNELHVWRIS